jgi:hypothetical protein
VVRLWTSADQNFGDRAMSLSERNTRFTKAGTEDSVIDSGKSPRNESGDMRTSKLGRPEGVGGTSPLSRYPRPRYPSSLSPPIRHRVPQSCTTSTPTCVITSNWAGAWPKCPKPMNRVVPSAPLDRVSLNLDQSRLVSNNPTTIFAMHSAG